jgi:hypothetical protein
VLEALMVEMPLVVADSKKDSELLQRKAGPRQRRILVLGVAGLDSISRKAPSDAGRFITSPANSRLFKMR